MRLKLNGVLLAEGAVEWVEKESAWLCGNTLYVDVARAMVVESDPVIPTAVSPRQIRQALTRAGLRTSVEAAVAAGGQDTKDWYEFATQFERSSPIVAALGAALSVTPLQLDDLWTLAGSL
jgi:hypothetical protein